MPNGKEIRLKDLPLELRDRRALEKVVPERDIREPSSVLTHEPEIKGISTNMDGVEVRGLFNGDFPGQTRLSFFTDTLNIILQALILLFAPHLMVAGMFVVPPGNDGEEDKRNLPLENFRALFETKFRHLDQAQRVALARTATGADLVALCFDPIPQVIAAIFSNPASGPVHARIIARIHHKPAGIEALARKPQNLQDPAVKRALMQNPVTPQDVQSRQMNTADLFQLYNIIRGHETTEGAKATAREKLREKFRNATPDECARFIILTEGRCLEYLYLERITPETTRILCKQTYTSLILVRNFTVFPALPSNLIRHLLKQQIVRQNGEMRTRLLHNPNCPGDMRK